MQIGFTSSAWVFGIFLIMVSYLLLFVLLIQQRTCLIT
jgi:hypothetical protein